MFDIFGEFDSVEELNKVAEGLFKSNVDNLEDQENREEKGESYPQKNTVNSEKAPAQLEVNSRNLKSLLGVLIRARFLKKSIYKNPIRRNS